MSRIRRMSYVITPEGHRANAIKQAADLRDKVLSIVDDANFSTSTARKITKKAAFSVVMRSLEESKGLPLSLREHLAMKELNSYIALAKHNKSDFFYAANADLLPISHPRSTREHSMTASALRISRSRWFAADPRITDEKAKAVLASAFESVPGSVEHLYYTSILLSLPQGIVPGDALIAATDGNSSESRSARARRQRRDSKGRFAYEGGGIRALIRRLNGEIFSVSGRVVANAKNSRDVEVEFPDGKIAQVNPVKGEYIKAVLPTPDGYSPKPIVPSVSDEVINEKDLVFLDAPNGWVKDETFKDFGDKVERYVDSNKEFVVFVSEKDDGTKDYQILNAKSAEQIDVVKTWADVQDRLEGKEDQLLDSKARLPKQQNAPVEAKGGFQYNYPDNAYKIRQDSEYDVQGRIDEESPDFTDDPVELAQKQDERDLLAALEQAVLPGEDGENALGVGALPFNKGDEFVPAEAIFFALQEAGMDAPMELAKIYDKKLGDNANEKALNDFRKKEEVVSGNTPELAESFKKVTEQNPDLELPTEEPKFDAKEAESAPLPALLEGLSQKELEQFVETKDHIPYLPKNEEIEMPEGYNPLSPEPFAAWKEVTAENPDAILPEGFSDNPVYLAQEIPTNDLLKELRRSVEPGNEVPGAAVIALPTEDGEDFIANVPGEAVRDALQLKGVDTNAELKKIADEGFVGQREEPVGQARDDDGISNDFIKKLIEMHLRKEGVVVFPGDAFKGTPEEKEFYEEKLFGKDFDTVRKILSEEAEKRGVSWPTIEEIGEWPSRSSEVPAERQPGPPSAKDIYERRMAGDSLDKVAKELGIPREEVRRLEAEYARTLDKAPDEPVAELPPDAPAEEKPMNAYERLMAENKAEAEAVEERVAKLKKDAEDRVDEQGRSVPEGWGFIAKNKPNFGQVDRPDNYFNVYGNNNFEASVDADGKITVKDRNGLLPDKSYDNWEDLQADLENQKSEYSSAARERVRGIAKKYGYSDEQIAAFDSMSQQELADFFANPENHTKAYADALDDLANSSAIDLPNAQQKARWAQMRKDEKILAQAGDAPSDLADIVDNQDIQEPQEIDNIPVEQEKLDDNKVEEDKTYVEENPEVIKVNAFVEANAGRLAPIKARDVKRGDFLWNNFNKVYEEILDIQPAAFGRVRFLIKDPRNQKEYFRFFDRRSPIRNMRRPGSGEVSEGFKVAPEENRGDGPKRGRALRQPLEERVEVVAGRDVGGFAYREGFYKDKNGVVLKPGDKVRHGNPKKDEMYGEGVVLVRAGDQIDEAKKVGGIGRGGKVYKDYVWVQIPGEAGPRLWKARMIVKQADNAGAEEAAPDAIADDKFAVPLMEPVVRKNKDNDLQEQIRRAIDAGDEVSFNYNGKTRYVKPVKIWNNPVNDNINVTAIENGEIKNFTISKMGYIEDPEGAALKRPKPLNVVFELDNDNIKNGLEEVRKGIKKLAKVGKTTTLKNAEAALDNFVGKLDVKDYRGMDVSELDALIRRLGRTPGADDLVAVVKQLKDIVEPEKQKLQLEFERKMFDEINNPLEAVVADAKTINAANVKEVIDEIVKRLPENANDGAGYRLSIVRRHLISYAKDIANDDDIIYTELTGITDAISYLEGLPVDVSGIKKQLEDLKKSVKGYAKNNKKPFGKANMPFIDPIALQEKRVADGVNKFDLANAQNLKALVAEDQFFVDNEFAAPYKDELQKFFAQDGEVPLASLSVDARQVLSQIISAQIRNLGTGSAEAKKARAKEYARMAIGLHEEKLAFNPNRDGLGAAGEALKDIDFDAVFSFGQKLRSDKPTKLEINGQPTGFRIQRVGDGINASYNYRLIDIASGQIFYFKRERTLETADAEYASNQLARALKIAGVPVVVKHNNDALVLIMTNAGDSLDFEKDPKIAGNAGKDYDDVAARAAIADLIAFGILDAVIANTDRHTHNFLLGGVDRGNVDGNGREEIQILPIDHGFAQLFQKNYRINDPLDYMTSGDGRDGGRINKAFAKDIGAVAYKELIDMTIQQAIQAIERGDYLSDVKPANRQAIIDRLLVLKGIDVDKWKSNLAKKL